MAVTKIWPVRGKPGAALSYVANAEKTANPRWNRNELQSLTDVMHYAADGEKTEKQFFVSGINCSPEIARDQFVTVKKQFGKEGGIVCYHGYQSFAEGEVTPEQAHRIGMEYARRVWGDAYQVVVATHLNTSHLHNHFVVNSVSFRHGRRLREKQWYELNKISDEICREHGLSVVERPAGGRIPGALYEVEKRGGGTRLNTAKAALDEGIAVSSTISELRIFMKSRGYICDFSPNRKYWTVRMKEWKRPIRFYRMGEEYTNEEIMRRLTHGEETKTFAVFHKAVYVKKAYMLSTRGDRLKKTGGIRGLYLYYCYLLGYLPKYRRGHARVPAALRDDIAKLDMIAEEARLLCRENISTQTELAAFAEKRISQLEEKGGQRQELLKKMRRKIPPEEKEKLKEDADVLKQEMRKLRKEIRLSENIGKRTEHIMEKIQEAEREEVKENERRR